MNAKGINILKILMEGVLTLLLVTFLSFLMMRLSPVDPAEAYARRNTVQPSRETIERIREEMGLTKPLMVQYGEWLIKAVHLDFGTSLTNNKPVVADLVFAAKSTLKIAGISAVLQMVITFLIGYVEYLLYESQKKIWLNILTIVLISIPPFYIASLYMDVLAVKIGFFKIINAAGFVRYFSPAFCIALPTGIFYGRLFGSMLNKERRKDYVFFLKARGLSENKVFFNHVLPSGLLMLIPVFMQNLGMILASQGILEKMFNVPGIGYMLIDHVIARDAPMIHGTILFFALIMVVTNISGKLLQIGLSGGYREGGI